MLSMTGFFRFFLSHTLDKKDISIEVQLKSVNSKGCDVHIRLPSILSHLEIDINRTIKSYYKRGTISCIIWIHGNVSQRPGTISLDAALRYYELLVHVKKTLDIKSDISLGNIMSLPGVIVTDEVHTISEEIDTVVVDALKKTIMGLSQELSREGMSIQACINGHLAAIKIIFARICERTKHVIACKRNKIESLAREASGNASLPDVLAVEIFRQLEKNDVSEEIERFESHYARLEQLINSSVVEKGRHSDFIMQELFREANTTGAKCNDIEISRYLIELKMELEKIREQLCNVA